MCLCAYVLETMNVTLKLEDDLCKAARHRAVDANLSLSGWITELLKRELLRKPSKTTARTLLEALGTDDSTEFEFFRNKDDLREVDF